MNDFYKTKVTIECEVLHQFAPEVGINIILRLLYNIPAITKTNVIDNSIASNYSLNQNPLHEMSKITIDHNKLLEKT